MTIPGEDVDNEEVYKMAAVMSDCGGLKMMLDRLASVRDLVLGKPLMAVLLKLFSFCVKVKVNRQQLVQPDMNTISVMLRALNLVGLNLLYNIVAYKFNEMLFSKISFVWSRYEIFKIYLMYTRYINNFADSTSRPC